MNCPSKYALITKELSPYSLYPHGDNWIGPLWTDNVHNIL